MNTIEYDYQLRWEARSSIRSRPRKVIDFEKPGYFFPIKKQVLFLSNEINSLDESQKAQILLLTLYKYLHDIINLEVKYINAACNKILYLDLGISYSDRDKIEIQTILIDELYHVYIARDMLQQLQTRFPDLPRLEQPSSDAYNSIENIKQYLTIEQQNIFEILAVCIFETTLIKELVEIFDSEEVHPSIKYYVNDHMNDESRHYGFFLRTLKHTWDSMQEAQKQAIGQHLANFILLYLNIESEKQYNKNILRAIFPGSPVIDKITDDLYKGFVLTPEMPMVKNVINVLKQTGIFDHPTICKSFKIIGWNI